MRRAGEADASDELAGLRRPAEQIALAEVQPEAAQGGGLVLGLDALRYEAAFGEIGEVTEPGDDRLARGVAIKVADPREA